MRCSSCQADLPANARFCPNCAAPAGDVTPERPADPLREALEAAVSGNFDVLRLLGRGGMGAVYLARERALDRLVAIKVLPPEASGADGAARFRREAQTAARLAHPNIVPLHSFGDVDGMLYFVMGYVDGESLAARLRDGARIPEDESRRILAELAEALAYAHSQGIVHRDIKPDNVLIDRSSGRAMLTDFGVAKATASGETLTQLGAVVGTPAYMSPEQASGERHIDGRSDIYSLGILAYRMLAGRLPFEGDSAQQIVVQHIGTEPVPLRRVAPDVSPSVETTIARCLAKAREERWTDAAQLGQALAKRADPLEMVKDRSWFDGIFFEKFVPVGYVFAALAFAVIGGDMDVDSNYAHERVRERAESFTIPDRVGAVNDFADVLDPAMEDSLTSLATATAERVGGDIAIVTLDGTGPLSPQRAATQISRDWAVGRSADGHDAGIVVLWVRDAAGPPSASGHIALGLAHDHGYLTDDEGGFVAQQIRNVALSEGRFVDGMALGIELIGEELESDRSVPYVVGRGMAMVLSPAEDALVWGFRPLATLLIGEVISQQAGEAFFFSLVLPSALLSPFALLTLIAVPLTARRRRIPVRDVIRQFFRQPKWWTGWFPGPLRHPATRRSWARASTLVKVTATSTNLIVLSGLVYVLYETSIVVGAFTDRPIDNFYGWPGYEDTVAAVEATAPVWGILDYTQTVFFLLFVIAFVTVVVKYRRAGLGFWDRVRLADGALFKPTVENVLQWNRDEMLSHFPDRETATTTTPTAPRSPSEILKAIETMVPLLDASAQSIGREAAASAVELSQSLGMVENEIERLSRDVTPGELERAREKLQALEANASGESDDTRQMRDLARSQLELLEKLERRRGDAAHRRDKMLALMRNLWLQLAELRAQSARDADPSEITEEIRTICDDIRNHVTARGEADEAIRQPPFGHTGEGGSGKREE